MALLGPRNVKVRRMLGPFGGQPQSEVVVTANVYNYELEFPAGTSAFSRVPDLACMDPQIFTTMTPPRTAAGTGSNTMNRCGAWMAQASTAANAQDPFQRNFVSFKIDHPGWNCCNPRQWNANVTQFAYVKSSPVVLEITLPDPPISKAAPVVATRPAVFATAAALGTYQTTNMGSNPAVPLWNETRPTGAWQYIIIPPQKGASINLSQVTGYVNWQKLLQIGYKPQTCRGKTYKCVCAAKGADTNEQQAIYAKLGQLTAGAGVIPAANGAALNSGPGSYNTVHKQQETDWSVQLSTAAAPADTFAGAQAQMGIFVQQGFDVLAFGSGIVFQFVQYAPPCLDGTSTASSQILPITLTIHSKTTFRQLKSASQDIGQVSTLPVVGGV